ncbi:MAG: HAMP domain-containing histidine kinase [Ahniella sp.]|nr:HAMP domain-containing histidine kinase [Ahniella sp.]
MRVSHDLRNPISGILGLCASLRLQGLDAHAQKLVGSVESAARGMGSLAQDLLDHGQLERGKLGLRPRPVDLAANLREFAGQYQARAEGRGLSFVC